LLINHIGAALVTLLLFGYYFRTRRIQGKTVAPWEVQLKAADRQGEALERIDAALEASRPSHFTGSEVKKLNGRLRSPASVRTRALRPAGFKK
jgi:hypothetical protein